MPIFVFIKKMWIDDKSAKAKITLEFGKVVLEKKYCFTHAKCSEAFSHLSNVKIKNLHWHLIILTKT